MALGPAFERWMALHDLDVSDKSPIEGIAFPEEEAQCGFWFCDEAVELWAWEQVFDQMFGLPTWDGFVKPISWGQSWGADLAAAILLEDVAQRLPRRARPALAVPHALAEVFQADQGCLAVECMGARTGAVFLLSPNDDSQWIASSVEELFERALRLYDDGLLERTEAGHHMPAEAPFTDVVRSLDVDASGPEFERLWRRLGTRLIHPADPDFEWWRMPLFSSL